MIAVRVDLASGLYDTIASRISKASCYTLGEFALCKGDTKLRISATGKVGHYLAQAVVLDLTTPPSKQDPDWMER